MTEKPRIFTQWAMALVVACGAAALPLWGQGAGSGNGGEVSASGEAGTETIRKFSVESQNLYRKVSASLFRVKLDISPENALPGKLKKEFEEWKEKYLKDHAVVGGAATAPSGDGNVSVTIEPREPRAGARLFAGGGGRRLANATQPFGGVMANGPLFKKFLDERLQGALDLESSLSIRQALQRLEALRNAQSNEALGVVLDNEGYALVLSPLVQGEAGKAVTITGLDGTEGQATYVGSDMGRGYSVVKLEKHGGLGVSFAEAKPAVGELLMCVNGIHGGVGWISMPMSAGGPGRKGEDRFAVFGADEHTPVYLFNLNGQLAAVGSDRHAGSIEDLKREWEGLRKNGHMTARRPFGVKYDVVAADSPYRTQYKNLGDRPALRVTGIFPGTAAARSGLKEGDFLLTIDGQAITGAPRAKGGPAHLVVLRDDQEISMDLLPEKGEK